MAFIGNLIQDFKNRDWYKTMDKDTRKELKSLNHSLNDKDTKKYVDLKSWRKENDKGESLPLHKLNEGLNTNKAEDYKIQDSTCVDKISYNPLTKALGVIFKKGKKQYLYPNVPEEKVDKLVNADSKGGYFSKAIKQYSINQ